MTPPTLTRFFSASLAAVSLWSTPATAVAQETNKAAAEALFLRAQERLMAGENVQACAEFAASHALDPALGTLLYLGDCYEATERYASAWATFREASDLALQQNDQKRGQIAAVRAKALEPKLHRVLLVVSDAAPGFELRQAGKLVPPATFGLPLPVDAGELTLEATAPNRETWTKKLEIPKTPGEARIVVPQLQPTASAASAAPPAPNGKPAAPPAATPVAPAESSWTQTHTAYTFGIAGLVGLGAGAGFGLAMLAKNDASRSECNDNNQCSPRGVDLRDKALRSGNIATIASVAGGALLGTGLVLLFTAPSDTESVSLQLGPTHAQLTFKGDL
jgi:serine/threonine-protein kinase